MRKIEELRNYLLKNYVNKNGDLFLGGLDFGDFNGDVYIGYMKVQGDLFQHEHEVQGNLYQGGHDVQGSLYQSGQKVQGVLNQSFQKAQGDLYSIDSQYGGKLYETLPIKILKEVTAEELAELGYKLKGEN